MAIVFDLNRYLHDFTSALWVAGSILIWLMMREGTTSEPGPETQTILARLISQVRFMTIPALVLTLCTGGVRAVTFEQYELVGDLNNAVIATLIIKHIAFTIFVSWGIWIHWKSRPGYAMTSDVLQ